MRHPVHQTILEAAYSGRGGMPSDEELDKLKLEPKQRARVKKACKACASIHATGHQAEAWARADELADAIIEELPEDQREPDYIEFTVKDPTVDMGPRELAEHTNRREL